MKDTYFSEMVRFIENHCPMPCHWCNGEPIPKAGRKFKVGTSIKDQEPCEYYDPIKGCLHPENPKARKRKRKAG